MPNTKSILPILGVAVVALVLGLAFGAIAFPTTSTQTITKVSTAQPTTVYYGIQTVTVPVPCCANIFSNIPQSFEIGNYLFNVTSYAQPPPTTINGTLRYQSGGVLVIFRVASLNENGTRLFYQEANFSWVGTFSETVPHPSNATLWNGDVRLNWFVNSTMLYLQVSTGTSSATTSVESFLLGSSGVLNIQGIGSFYYLQDNSSIPQTFTYRNVTFSHITGKTYTGGTCDGYTITFKDGSSENLTACSTPFDFPTVFVFTQHKSPNGNPQAGLAMSANGALYFLVSWL